MLKNMFLLCLTPLLVQCASLGGTYEKEKVQKIKKVALVGFTYDAPLETSDHMMSSLMGNEDDPGPGLMGAGKMEKISPETTISKAAYDQLAANFKKAGWQVKSASDVQGSPSVNAFYNKSIKVGYYPLQKGKGRYERAKIPQFIHVSSLGGKGEFAKMAKDLGVDAIAVAYVHAKGSQSIPMVSKISHSADVTIQIFDPASDTMVMNFSSGGKEVQGSTKTKIGKDFVADMQKGTMASIDQFGDDFQKKLQN